MSDVDSGRREPPKVLLERGPQTLDRHRQRRPGDRRVRLPQPHHQGHDRLRDTGRKEASEVRPNSAKNSAIVALQATEESAIEIVVYSRCTIISVESSVNVINLVFKLMGNGATSHNV